MVGKGAAHRSIPAPRAMVVILREALEAAPMGADRRVVHPSTIHDLRRTLGHLAKAAGIKPWRKPYQALRSSCENEWKAAGIAEPTYLAWMGGTDEDSVFYYRIHSPVILIEFDHQAGIALDSDVPTRQHIHTVVRTPNGNDYGKDLLRQHLEQVSHSHD